MFERFRDGLVYPGRVILFRKDSFIRVLSYILIFAVLMSVGLGIFLIRFDSFPNSYVNTYKENLTNSEVNCEVVNQNLICDEELQVQIYGDNAVFIYVDSTNEIDYENIDLTRFNFIFHENQIILNTAGMVIPFEISELPEELHNLDFKLLSTDSQAFAKQLLDGVSSYMMVYKNVWVPIVLVLDVLTNLFIIFAIILINSWVIKSRFKIIPFKEIFRMSVYSSTGILLLFVINGMVALSYIIIFLFIILTFRQTNQLSLAISKVIKKK